MEQHALLDRKLWIAPNGFNEIRLSALERMAGTTRLELATSAVTATYKTRGDCQTTRKSYKTSHSVGWVVGWKKAVFLNKRVASPSRGNCFDRTNPRP